MKHLLKLSDFKKVEAALPSYLSTYPQSQLEETRRVAHDIDANELTKYVMLLTDAFQRGKMDEALYEFAISQVHAWESASFHEKFALGLLVKKTLDDTALWDLLCHR